MPSTTVPSAEFDVPKSRPQGQWELFRRGMSGTSRRCGRLEIAACGYACVGRDGGMLEDAVSARITRSMRFAHHCGGYVGGFRGLIRQRQLQRERRCIRGLVLLGAECEYCDDNVLEKSRHDGAW